MTWENRFRLLGGLIAVVVLVGALTVVFNQRQHRITSFTGHVTAPAFEVGADYPGTVIAQQVSQGDKVRRGQPLFTVQSLQLKESLGHGLEVADTEAYTVDTARGTISYVAVSDGEITRLNARQGNSVQLGGTLATLTAAGDREIEATFRLARRDYARVQAGAVASITLPNDQIITGAVVAVSAATGETGTVATMRVSSPQLASVPAALSSPGAPVSVTVELADSGPFAGITDLTYDFLAKAGLR